MVRAKVRVAANLAGMRALRNSAEVQADLLARAQRIGSRAETMGGDYAADVRPGKTRAHAMVKTDGVHAARANAKKNSLLKSIDAGR